jgi:hypothetical protein
MSLWPQEVDSIGTIQNDFDSIIGAATAHEALNSSGTGSYLHEVNAGAWEVTSAFVSLPDLTGAKWVSVTLTYRVEDPTPWQYVGCYLAVDGKLTFIHQDEDPSTSWTTVTVVVDRIGFVGRDWSDPSRTYLRAISVSNAVSPTYIDYAYAKLSWSPFPYDGPITRKEETSQYDAEKTSKQKDVDKTTVSYQDQSSTKSKMGPISSTVEGSK